MICSLLNLNGRVRIASILKELARHLEKYLLELDGKNWPGYKPIDLLSDRWNFADTMTVVNIATVDFMFGTFPKTDEGPAKSRTLHVVVTWTVSAQYV